MQFSPPRLHPPVISSAPHRAAVAQRLKALVSARLAPAGASLAAPDTIVIPLSTVSLNSNFDAYIEIGFKGSVPGPRSSLLVDSGNSTLIVPRWEDIAALPNSNVDYQILGSGKEPWGCPANIVRGPISIQTTFGAAYEISDCVFYACTDAGPNSPDRTANFGAACLTPWSTSGWNVPTGIGVTMQAPLSYNTLFPYAEFAYAAATDIHGPGPAPTVASGSSLCLYKAQPAGYQMFSIMPSKDWMALTPIAISIQGTTTGWPGAAPNPIAVIDTGGGPVFLTDPNQYVCATQWPDPVQNPPWTSTSDTCKSVNDSIGVVIGDDAGQFSYVIDPAQLPVPAQGLTLVMCKNNYYMMKEQGMNIGGISALVNTILIDYGQARVGLRPR
jgi:hypothetical protein